MRINKGDNAIITCLKTKDIIPATVKSVTKSYLTVLGYDKKLYKVDPKTQENDTVKIELSYYKPDFDRSVIEYELIKQSVYPICQLCHKETLNTMACYHTTLSENYFAIRNVLIADLMLLKGHYYNRKNNINYICSDMTRNIGSNWLHDKEKEKRFNSCHLNCNCYNEEKNVCKIKIYNNWLKVKTCTCKSSINEIDTSCELCTAYLNMEIKELKFLLALMLEKPQYFTCMHCFTTYFAQACKSAYDNAFKSEEPIRLKRIKDAEEEVRRSYRAPSYKELEDMRRETERIKANDEYYRDQIYQKWVDSHY